MSPQPPLRVGYVPEHFSTPLHFAQVHRGLQIEAIPFPSGTGHMISALQSHTLDIAIGLTEAWISGLGKAASASTSTSGGDGAAGYQLVGSYVETPLCWAISTGAGRGDVREGSLGGLKGRKMGVSRVGSGSYVMGFVLADQENWLDKTGGEAFAEIVPLQTFERLRKGVIEGEVDFFMWEHFTTKRYFDNGELKRVGEIYTPWPSWAIVATPEVVGERGGARLQDFMERLNAGIEYFWGHRDEAVEYISTELDYSREDAQEWLKTVRFAEDVRGVRKGMVEGVVKTLKKAGVLEESVGEAAIGKMAAYWKDE